MRALLAGLFTVGGLFVCVVVVFHYFPNGIGPAWLMGVGFAVLFLTLALTACVLFNSGSQLSGGKSTEEYVAELESRGLLVTDDFKAIRAFQLHEFEDEGSHYYIELSGGEVLYLNGQYLYDYEEIVDDPELNQTRKFPCSEFTVRRHKIEGFAIDIVCAGDVLPPELVAPAFDRADFNTDLVPEDGEIIKHRTYEQLKSERKKIS